MIRKNTQAVFKAPTGEIHRRGRLCFIWRAGVHARVPQAAKRLVHLSLFISLLTACANYGTAPTGGPKDLAPPVFLQALPAQGTTGFQTPATVKLSFDEYITLKEIDKIVVSPPLQKISYSYNLKTVTVSIDEDSLPDNQTYSINFGNAVGDLHESTPLQGFTYVFSTGQNIDSGQLSGVLRDAATTKPVKGASLLFFAQKPLSYPPDTMPDYVAVSDTGGFFSVSYMKEGCYYIIGVQESARDYMLDPTEEPMAFSDTCWQTEPLTPQILFSKKRRMKESDTAARASYDRSLAGSRAGLYGNAVEAGHILYLYQDYEEYKFLKESKFSARGEIQLFWNFALEADSFSYEFLPSQNDEDLVNQFYASRASLPDSSDTKETRSRRRIQKVQELSEEDLPDLSWPERLHTVCVDDKPSLQTRIFFDDYSRSELRLVVRNGCFADTVDLNLPTAAAKKQDTARFRVSASSQSLVPTDSLVLNFTLPLSEYNFDSAILYQFVRHEDARTDTVVIRIDQLEKSQPNALQLVLKYAWTVGASYQLFLPSACFRDNLNRQTDTTQIKFSVPDLMIYGEVAVTLQGLDSGRRYILQLASPGGKQVYFQQEVYGDGLYEFLYVKPSVVTFILFEDPDGDGFWTRGHYPASRQPENRRFYHKEMKAEAEWRMEETWSF